MTPEHAIRSGDLESTQLNVRLTGIQLDPIVRAFNPSSKPYPGRVDTTGTLLVLLNPKLMIKAQATPAAQQNRNQRSKSIP